MLDEPGLVQLSAVRLLYQILQFIIRGLFLQKADMQQDLEDIDVCKYIINLYCDDDLSRDIREGTLCFIKSYHCSKIFQKPRSFLK